MDKETAKGCDYWQSPIETLVRGIGECEDFAMAKYASLRLLRIPAGQFLVAVIKGNFSHKNSEAWQGLNQTLLELSETLKKSIPASPKEMDSMESYSNIKDF